VDIQTSYDRVPVTASSPLSGVADRYAGALFELCTTAAKIKATEKDLDALDKSLSGSEDLTRLIKSPVFSTEDQVRAIDALLAKSKTSDMTANFIRVVAQNRRLFVLPAIIESFRRMAADARGEVAGDVTSAVKLTAAQLKDLKAALKAKVGKDVALNEIVDPSVLGGLIVKVGSQMIDTSIRTKLTSLKMMMKEVG